MKNFDLANVEIAELDSFVDNTVSGIISFTKDAGMYSLIKQKLKSKRIMRDYLLFGINQYGARTHMTFKMLLRSLLIPPFTQMVYYRRSTLDSWFEEITCNNSEKLFSYVTYVWMGMALKEQFKDIDIDPAFRRCFVMLLIMLQILRCNIPKDAKQYLLSGIACDMELTTATLATTMASRDLCNPFLKAANEIVNNF